MSVQLESIPPAWPVGTLSAVAVGDDGGIVGGPFGSLLTTEHYTTDGVPVIRGSNMGGKTSTFLDGNFVFVSPSKASELERNQAVPGDLIFTQRGTMGQVAIIPTSAGYERYIVSQSQMRVRVDSTKVDPRYVYWWYRSKPARQLLELKTLVTGVPHINLGILREFPIPLAPMEQQRRIVAVLDKSAALRARRDGHDAAVTVLLRSSFEQMFGEPSANTMKWPVLPLGEVLSGIDSGWSPVCESRPAEANEWGVLKLGAVTQCRFEEGENKALLPGVEPVPELEVRASDVLFARKNTYDLVAAVAYVTHTRPHLMLPDLLFRLRCGSRLHPAFLAQCLTMPRVRKAVQSLAAGSSGSMPGISKAKLREFSIPVPPLDRQQRFAAIVHRVSRYDERVRTSIADLDTLHSTLLHRAFTGTL